MSSIEAKFVGVIGNDNGVCKNIITIDSPIGIMVEREKNTNDTVRFHGFLVNIFKLYAELTNMCFNIFVSPPGNMGVRLENGTYTKILGQLQQKQFDIYVKQSGDRNWRGYDVELTEYHDSSSYVMTLPYPEETSQDIFALLRAFPPMIWTLVGVSFLILSGIFAFLSWRYSKKYGKSFLDIIFEVLTDVFACYLGFALDLGRFERMIGGKRILLTTWFLFVIIILQYVKSELTSLMASREVVLPFNNFEELLQQKELIYTVGEFSIIEELVMSAPKDHQLGRFRDTMGPPLAIPMMVECLVEQTCVLVVLKSQYQLYFKILYGQYGCVATTLDANLFSVKMGLPIHKDVSYKQDLNRRIIQMREAGFLEKWRKDELPRPGLCSLKELKRDTNKYRPLNLSDFTASFIFFGIGMLIACLIFLFEIAAHQIRMRNAKAKAAPKLSLKEAGQSEPSNSLGPEKVMIGNWVERQSTYNKQRTLNVKRIQVKPQDDLTIVDA